MENAPPVNAANLAELNKRILEIKRKIVLKEGQKKANMEEWEAEKKQTNDKINELKNETKALTAKLKFLHNPTKKNQKQIQQDSVVQQQKKIPLPKGAKSSSDGVMILDLQIIDLQKQIDLYQAKIVKNQELCDKLHEEHQKLISYKNEKAAPAIQERPPETQEEDQNRKLVTRLENEIHKMEVQWNEAEHIRKKYRSIKNSLMMDSEKFESTLLKMEAAIKEQQQEINKLQAVFQEALQMRDSTKSVLVKQEQTTIASNKSRERQAAEFRRQVEERKAELERLERKIFASGTKIVHQDSAASSGKMDDEDAIIRDSKAQMEANFKKLMTATGVTVSNELVDRFLAQREASARLTYLRNVTEHEKKRLESQREQMTQQLDVFKFSDNRENEVNQEELERVKKDIEDQKSRKMTLDVERERTNVVLESIKNALVSMLMKLQDMDEVTADLQAKRRIAKNLNFPAHSAVNEATSTDQIVQMLQEKVKVGLIATGQIGDGEGIDSGLSEEEDEPEEVERKDSVRKMKKTQDFSYSSTSQAASSETAAAAAGGLFDDEEKRSETSFAIDEKPPPYPQVYSSLITGRSTGLVSASPGAGGGAGSEEEADVPSRSFLKRQANLILDAKSRRKLRQQGGATGARRK